MIGAVQHEVQREGAVARKDAFDRPQFLFVNRRAGNLVGGPSTPPVGNAYNPGANVQTFLRYPYEPYFGTYNDLSSSLNQPFNAYFSVKVKI